MKPPIEKNKNEASIELLCERILIAIEQIPVPINQPDDARLEAAEEKLWEALDILATTKKPT